MATIFLVVAIFVGSGIWWVLLTGFTNNLKYGIRESTLKKIDVLSGLILIFFGFILPHNLIKGIR